MKLTFDKLPFIYREKSLTHSGGETSLCLMTIDPKYKGDKGLYAHEHRHIIHWWIVTILSYIGYYFAIPFIGQYFFIFLALPLFTYQLVQKIPAVRLWVELDCYAVQLQYHTNNLEPNLNHFAKILSTKYGLKISQEEAYKRLLDKLL